MICDSVADGMSQMYASSSLATRRVGYTKRYALVGVGIRNMAHGLKWPRPLAMPGERRDTTTCIKSGKESSGKCSGS